MRKFIVAGLVLILTACGGTATMTPSNNTTTAQTPAAVGPTTVPAGSTSVAATATAGATTGDGTVPEPGTVEATAAQSVSQILSIPVDQLKLLNKEEKEWSDSSLGCAEEGMMYLQVITPGFLLNYTDGTNSYTVHTDTTGSKAVVCDNGKPRKTS